MTSNAAGNPRDIKKEILDRRLERMATQGPGLGVEVPLSREVPLVPFLQGNGVICEIKRRSPSRGSLNSEMNAVTQGTHYFNSGVKTVSVLTEEDHFQGSLKDLMDVKRACPELAVLRKDFLATPQDVEISYRAGADGILLIASLLDFETLRDLYFQAKALGLAVLMEVHSQEDIEKIRPLRPRFTGINCRDLGTFRIDLLIPLMVRPFIDWQTKVIFESGIFRLEEALWAGANGFQGILVGEGAVKNPQLPRELSNGFLPGAQRGFWQRLYGRNSQRPMVKICGLTRREDVELVDSLGADLLGFILAPSPRKVDKAFLKSLGGTKALKIGVLVLKTGEEVPRDVLELLEEGSLDALQFHGEETPGFLDIWGSRGYKAFSLQNLDQLTPYRFSPRVLVDAFVPGQAGGTGKVIDAVLLEGLKDQPLWLAGGLNPENIGEIVKKWTPELVDASSGLESSPGIKDHEKLKLYFKEIHRGSF